MILAQHGYGPSDKVQTGISDGSINGVIISASNANPDNLSEYCSSVSTASTDAFVLFDSEYYVNFIQDADKFGKLPDYSYFNHPMAPSDLASPKLLLETTKKIVDLQVTSGLSRISTPTIEITSFGSSNEPYSLSLLHSASEYVTDNHSDKELYGSLLINENAFFDIDKMALFLDSITRIRGINGYYIVIDRTDGQRDFWTNPQSLAAYMYLVHTLSASKEVVLGYADGASLLGLAVGAKYITNGWWQNSGNFTKKRFVTSGGRRRSTYYSKQLMSTIYVDGELSVLINKGFGDVIANTTKYDTSVSTDPLNPTSWNDRDAVFHKWIVMSEDDTAITSIDNETDRLKFLLERVTTAKDLSETMNASLPDGFKINHGPEKLRTWIAAIDQYNKGVI